MKKIYLLAIMLLFTSITYAQRVYIYGRGPGPGYYHPGYQRRPSYNNGPGFDNSTVVGLRVAFAGSTVSGTSSFTNGPVTDYHTTTSGILPGFTAGLFVESNIAPGFAIQPEFDYSLKGGSYSDRGTLDNDLLSYFSVPVLFKWKPVRGFSLYAGPEFGYLISAKNHYSTDTEGSSDLTVTDIRDNYNKFDVDLDLGIGFDLSRNVGFDARYSLGLTNISPTGGSTTVNGTTQTNTITNDSFQIGLNFKF